MPFLDTATKMVRLLSAVVWLGVGILTLWITWITLQEFQPFLSTLRDASAQLGGSLAGSGASPAAPGTPSLEEFLRASSGLRGSR